MSENLKTGQINYDVNYSPDPLVINTRLSSENKKLKVKIDEVPNLKVVLKPKFSWNPVNDVLTAVGSLVNIFSSEIVSTIVTKAKGISIDIYTIPDIPIDSEGIHLTLSPSNIKLENTNGFLMVSADIDISQN